MTLPFCKLVPVTFDGISVMLTAKSKLYGSMMESNMITVLKWIIGALVAGFLWVVADYTEEYLRPYKKIRTITPKK